MTIAEAIKLIRADVDDEDVEWISPLGKAYKLSFEALKRVRELRRNGKPDRYSILPGETGE